MSNDPLKDAIQRVADGRPAQMEMSRDDVLTLRMEDAEIIDCRWAELGARIDALAKLIDERCPEQEPAQFVAVEAYPMAERIERLIMDVAELRKLIERRGGAEGIEHP